MSGDLSLLTCIRLSEQLKQLKSKLSDLKINAEYKESAKGTFVYVSRDDYENALSIVIDLRLDEVEDADLSIDDG
ncbi:MAG: hypothetical protein HY606_07240 [Planctomycetes bacterium]|nr:hypothetical protein [Planctomycetota bacterium]